MEGDADYHTFTLVRSHTLHVRGLPRHRRKFTVQVGALMSDVWHACPWTAVLVGAGGLEGLSSTRAQKPGPWAVTLLLPFCLSAGGTLADT